MTFRRLRRLFQSRGVPREEAADLAQEAIARALLHLNRNGADERYDGVDPLLNRIATNLLIDRARAAGPRLVSIESAEDIDDGRQDPSEEVARLHEHRAVRSAIGGLSPRHRHALLLTLDGKSPAEIAEHLGIQRNAADALLHRARRRLADRLRVSGDAALGLVAFAALRVRWMARRAAGRVRAMDPIAASPLTLNVAALAFATIVAAPAAAVPVNGPLDGPASRAVASVAHDADDARLDAGAAVASSRIEDGATNRSVRVGTGIPGPTSGEETAVRMRHRTEGTNGGVTAVVLDVVCGATAVCAEEPAP